MSTFSTRLHVAHVITAKTAISNVNSANRPPTTQGQRRRRR